MKSNIEASKIQSLSDLQIAEVKTTYERHIKQYVHNPW
jgi:hypothetical protein